MKRLLLFVVVFLILVGVVPAKAQGFGILGGGYRPSSPEGWMYYFQGDKAHMLLADQVNWIGETMRIGQRSQMRRVTDDLVGYGPYIGLQGPRGFYPMYQCSKGERWEKGIGTTMIVGAVGALLGGKKGAIAGAIGGAGYALYKDAKCNSVQNQMIVVDDPSDLQVALPRGIPIPQQQVPSSRFENGWNEILHQQQDRRGYQPIGGSNDPNRPWLVKNMTRGNIELFDGDEFIGPLSPSSPLLKMSHPKNELRALILAPNENGGVDIIEGVRVPRSYGWDIVTPKGGN